MELLYFYHSDYLGSVEFVTDMRGEAYQLARTAKLGGFFLNTPWGDRPLRNKPGACFSAGARLPRWRGNFYYGARYVVYPERSLGDPKISVWLSVEPLAARDANLSPYHFVKNNPLILVDPNGMTWDPANDTEGLAKYLREDVNEKIEDKQATISKANEKIEKYKNKDNWSEEKRNEKIKKQEGKIASAQEDIKYLSTIITALDDMKNSNKVFSFQASSSIVNYISMDGDGKIIVPYNSMANLVHESIHGGQVANGLVTPLGGTQILFATEFTALDAEVQAYRAQLAYSYGSMPKSELGSLTGYSLITPESIKGIYYITLDRLTGNEIRNYPYQ
ncbi:MAG: hypothetical protein NXI09_15780 [Bacteroidetes bacterium]|nr:hypothetical protein [Bacteroidota bacterium]